jgi:NADPH:quinone reductase-like Zn-dependent oxidoreductase
MHRRGPPGEALRYEEAWPAPVREPGQVLIEVAAASVNAGDWCVSGEGSAGTG